ncbi:MAG: sugar phosphate nucleotidyltransferase [Thaumarchaeota archaeon]|nr:sugar phosphate nucleotidyltransferase [Nitrososphaerota archaeon]
MHAVVMAGGEGSRLRPLTSTRPKPLVPVVNRPILWHVLRLVQKHDISEAHITLHYLADQITTAFARAKDLNIHLNYSFEDKPLGTAGSVKAIEQELSDIFLVISGDVMTDFDLTRLIEFHKKKGAMVTIGLARVQNPLEYGVVMTDPEGRISRFLEKPGWSEVFSDTVNSGIYVISKEALREIDPEKQYDFSKELFPKLLKRGEPIYALPLDGYWCDVGIPSQYITAHHDILSGKTGVEIPGKQSPDNIWIEEGAEIHSTAQLVGPCLIGSRSSIGKHASIGPLTCIGTNVSVESNAVVSRSVVYDFAYIGREAEAKGCVIGKSSVLRPRARVFEEAIVGDGTQLGTGTEVAQKVRIWPDKSIESGAIVRENLVWGLTWQRNIFGNRGIIGISNVEITPEITAKLGAAFGTFAGSKGKVVVARDTLRSSRMLKRSFIAGLLSTGNTVFNLRAAPLPLTRLSIVSNRLDGGVYFGTNPIEPDYSILQFLDSSGFNISSEVQRKIESILFKEEIHRSSYEELSDIYYLPQSNDAYEELVLKSVDSRPITSSRPRIVVDCALGPVSVTAPQILSKLGCEVVSLNASTGTYSTTLSVASSPSNLKDIVTAVGAVAGFRFAGGGDTIRIVDETGEMLSGDEALALMTEIMMRIQPGAIAVPVSSSGLIENIAERSGQVVHRLKTEPRALMEAVGSGRATFAGNDAGEFIVSKDLPFPDGLLAAGKIVEYLSSTGARIHEVKSTIYQPTIARGVVLVPWNERGRIMRRLAMDFGEKRVESLEGIKFLVEGGWVFINPSTDEPVFDIVAESSNLQSASTILREFQNKVSDIVTGNDTMT